MRVSTNQLQRLGVNAILEQQARVSKTQQQIASGKRILTPADDPAGAARALDLRQAIEATEQLQKNINAATSRLGSEENALIGVTNVLQRARELAIQGNNDSQTSETRKGIALEVRQLLEGLLGLANTKDANNEYIFSGYQGWAQPFSQDAAGNFVYAGDDGQRFVQIGPGFQIPVGDSGTDVFRAIRNGNGTFTTLDNPANTGTGIIDTGTVAGSFVADTYTITFTQALPTDPVTYEVTGVVSGVVIAAGTPYVPGASIAFNGVQTNITGTPANGDIFTVSPSANQDIFTGLRNLVNALESGAASDDSLAKFHNEMNRFLTDVDQSLDNIISVRARVGARLNTIDTQLNVNEDFLLQTRQALSGVEDLDYAEATARFNIELLALQAAQQAFIKVQGLSLFNFLR